MTSPAPEPALVPSPHKRYPWLLAALFGQLVFSPFLAGPLASLLEDLLFLVILLAAVGAVRQSRPSGLIRILALVCGLGIVLRYLMDLGVLELVFSALGAVVIVLVVVEMIRYLARQRRVDLDLVMGGLCVYLFFGVLWYTLYAMVGRIDPEAFSFSVHGVHPEPFQASRLLFFFSYVTLLTTGYGDIVPLSPVAQALAMLEGLVGQFYLVFFMARLVGLDIANITTKQDPVPLNATDSPTKPAKSQNRST